MKEIYLYTLLKSHKGYVPSNFPIGRIYKNGEVFEVECSSGALKEKITEIFNTPIYVRVACGDNFSFKNCLLDPCDEKFLEEAIYRLRVHNLWGKENE